MIRNTIIVNGLNGVHPLVPTLDVTPLVFHVGAEGDIRLGISVFVASESQAWSYEVSHPWCSVSGASLVGSDTTILLDVEPQPSGEQPPRNATITFRSDDCADKVITVNQDARAG